VTGPARRTAAQLRGSAAGLLTAALALVAHTAAGGMPSGAGVTLLAVLAGTVGTVAAASDRAADPRMLAALLATGQGVGHLTLAMAGHGHHADTPAVPQLPMLAAHALAVFAGAALIGAGDRLCRAVCTALRRFVTDLPRQLASAAATPAAGSDQPMHAALFLAASVSHRGPPVGLAPLT
jgi:hypothetical protein